METFDLALLERDHTEGTFSRYEIPRLLLTPIRKRLTGALKLVQGTAVRMIGFSNGAPTVAASSLAEERLGALLLARGALDASQITAIDEAMRSQGLQFGAAATTLGFLTKAELASWLKEQHAYVVTRCVLADGVRATFGPLGKLASARTGLPLLRCIEDGIRQYPPEALEELQGVVGDTRFFVSPQDVEVAHDLGCTQSLEQLLGQTDTARSFQDFMASSEDDDPAVPILTLVLTRLALPEGSAAEATAASSSVDSFAAASSASEPVVTTTSFDAPAEPSASGSDFKPASSVDELQAMLEASRHPTRTPPPSPPPSSSRAAEVDSLLSSLTTPSRPASEFGIPASEPTLSISSSALPDLPPAPASSKSSILDELISTPSEPASRPTPGFDFGLDLAPQQPARAVTPAPVASQPLSMSTASIPIPRVITSDAGTVPLGPGGIPTLPANSPYAVVPRELLSAVNKAQRAASPGVRIGKAGALVVLGAVLGIGGVWFVKPAFLVQGGGVPAGAIAMADAHAGKPAAAAPAGREEAGSERRAAEAEAPAQEAPKAAPEPERTADTKPAAEEKPAAEAPKPAEEPRAAEPAEKPVERPVEKPKPKPRRETPEPARTEPTRPATPPPASNGAAAQLAQVRKLLGSRDYRGTIVLCTQILTADPRNAQAYRSMGIAYSGLGAKPQACESYRRYLRLAGNPPDRAQIENILGACN